jgi:hypothetical protein
VTSVQRSRLFLWDDLSGAIDFSVIVFLNIREIEFVLVLNIGIMAVQPSELYADSEEAQPENSFYLCMYVYN